MITGIKPSLFVNTRIYKNKIEKHQNTCTNVNNLNLMNYMNIVGKNNLSFCANIKPSEDDFNKTVEYNYFKLPKLKNSKGELIQAQPDKTQLECAKSLYQGNDTICVAPTGTGKTAIANYAISKNLYDGKRTFYTTPLKALSNDKYREFTQLYGKDNVGLLTGDIKMNAKAPIVIMTTEIYRNMALGEFSNSNNGNFENVGTVVFDEAHYIDDDSRGKIWEESLMLTPNDVQVLALSATVGNAGSFTNWIASNRPSANATLIQSSPKDRHVPLVFYNYTGKKGKEFAELIKGEVNIAQIKELNEKGQISQRQARAIDDLYRIKNELDFDEPVSDENRKEILSELNWLCDNRKTQNYKFMDLIKRYYHLKEIKAREITQLLLDSDTKTINVSASNNYNISDTNPNDYSDLVEALKEDDKLPAIIFKFSRKGCNKAARYLAKGNLNLTTDEEKEKIQEIIDSYHQNGIFLGDSYSRGQLLKGVAVHHAGILPSYKKLVEELFSKKLVKVVVATSTLSAGINMPAKTVVVTSVNHPSAPSGNNLEDLLEGEKMTPLTSNEFHQMTGRAGRRGIDTIGNVVLYNLTRDDQETAEKLILQAPNPLISKYKPTYNFLSSYYANFKDDDLINLFQNETFRVFQAGSRSEKELHDLQKEFEGYKNVLLSEGCLEKDPTTGVYQTTAKGRLLSKMHGYNELTLVDLIFNKKFEGATEFDIAAIACAMTSTNLDDDDSEKIIENLSYIYDSIYNSKFISLLENAKESDERILDSELENDFLESVNQTDTFLACAGYIWSKINAHKNYNEPSANFRKLIEALGDVALEHDNWDEGHIYRSLTQGVDVLKQIISVCEAAMADPELIDDFGYYNDLYRKTSKAINLVQKSPIYDVDGIA